jgi:DNA-binding winged helix-turn-helix (wHTH) protein/tetratricopeptide (TPR) repeat protein
MKPNGIFQFGDFKVDSLSRTLRCQEEIITLNRRAFDVLLYLVQNPGRVLTRDELLKNIWSDTVVDENSLAQSISVLRRALDEKPGDNSYIVTLPGRGYQFVSAVKVSASETLTIVPGAATSDENSASKGILLERETIRTSVITEEPEETEEKDQLSVSRRWSSATVRVGVVLSLAVAAIVGFYAWKRSHRVPPPPDVVGSAAAFPATRRSIAVLGFRNLSGRPEEGWLSTALAEMLSTELVAGEKLRLVSGEDIARARLEFPLADADSLSRNTLAQLHQDLGSDLIVLGSYTALGEKSDKRIRLDLRLQDTVAGETIADVAVLGSEADLFDLASQAGARLREKLGVEVVSPVEAVSVRASSPSNRDAARFYSEGLARLRVFDFLEASDLLQRAVAADPRFALAHSALAEAWFPLGYDKKSQQEARQAYELSANLSREEKLVVEGRYRNFNHEYQKAIEVYRALFTLFPDNIDYGLRLARVQDRGGKGRDALATVELLRKLAPPASEDPRIELEEATAWTALGDLKHQEDSLARAVEKAKAQGARLILAEAWRQQCSLFRYLKPQDAVSGCREAKDIFAAAGDRNDEARSLRTWADAIAETDAPESIRLYQQAQAIFRKNGSQANVADVLNNLGNVYEAQGDPASSEKMLREALAIYRALDDKRGLVSTIGNIGDDRMDQGDLRGAIQLYEEQLQLGDPANPYPVYNIGYVRQLQGDLAGAKQRYEQALAAWQKSGDQDSSAYAMWGLGNLLLLGADFSSARKMYEQSLALRTAAGDKLTIAETQVGLADLSLEESRSPTEQEAVMRQVLEVFQKQKAHDDEIRAWCALAHALLAESKIPAAKEALQHARSLAAKSQNPEIRWQAAIAAAHIENAEKHVAHSATETATRKELAAIISKSRELGYQGIELDARLALAETEIKEGQVTAGRAHLADIEVDAKAKGYTLVARKAAITRG